MDVRSTMSRFIGLLKETFQEFAEDKAPRLGAIAQATRVEDRPKIAQPVVPTPMPLYARQRSGGVLAKVAVGGLAGLLFGAIFGGVSTLAMVVKGAKRMLSWK